MRKLPLGPCGRTIDPGRSFHVLSTLVTLLVMAQPFATHASDGVLEINQTCAVETGCFAQDLAGFPVTISSSGSYRLTSNLVVPNESTDGIQVGDHDVSIDLGGFEITRAACVGATTSCTPASGSGVGIEIAQFGGFLPSGTTVRNGTVTGMGGFGLSLGSQSEVHRVRARWNRITGILVGNGSTITNCVAHENGIDGIRGERATTAIGNSSYANGSDGIDVWLGSTVLDNSVSLNQDDGIDASLGNATVARNTARENVGDGIVVGDGSTVTGNSTHLNGQRGLATTAGATVEGNSVSQNGTIGIEAGAGANVSGNTVRGNASFGLMLDATATYRDNTITAHPNGSVSGGMNMGGNACEGVVCP